MNSLQRPVGKRIGHRKRLTSPLSTSKTTGCILIDVQRLSFSQIPRSQSWLRHLMDHGDRYSDYQCAKTNPYLDHPKAFEEGLQRLREHDIVNAILLFESAVQKQANHADVS